MVSFKILAEYSLRRHIKKIIYIVSLRNNYYVCRTLELHEFHEYILFYFYKFFKDTTRNRYFSFSRFKNK